MIMARLVISALTVVQTVMAEPSHSVFYRVRYLQLHQRQSFPDQQINFRSRYESDVILCLLRIRFIGFIEPRVLVFHNSLRHWRKIETMLPVRDN